MTAKAEKQAAGKAKSRRVKVEKLPPNQVAKEVSASDAKKVAGGRVYRASKLTSVSTDLSGSDELTYKVDSKLI